MRNLDSPVKGRLRVRAAEHGHSMEAEARHILRVTLTQSERPIGRSLYDRVRDHCEALGGADEMIVAQRLPDREPPHLG